MRILFMCTANSCRAVCRRCNRPALPSMACTVRATTLSRATRQISSSPCATKPPARPARCIGPALKAHWGLEDPSEVAGDEATVNAAFHATLMRIGQRCQVFLDLPFDTLSRDELKTALDRIGAL